MNNLADKYPLPFSILNFPWPIHNYLDIYVLFKKSMLSSFCKQFYSRFLKNIIFHKIGFVDSSCLILFPLHRLTYMKSGIQNKYFDVDLTFPICLSLLANNFIHWNAHKRDLKLAQGFGCFFCVLFFLHKVMLTEYFYMMPIIIC